MSRIAVLGFQLFVDSEGLASFKEVCFYILPKRGEEPKDPPLRSYTISAALPPFMIGEEDRRLAIEFERRTGIPFDAGEIHCSRLWEIFHDIDDMTVIFCPQSKYLKYIESYFDSEKNFKCAPGVMLAPIRIETLNIHKDADSETIARAIYKHLMST